MKFKSPPTYQSGCFDSVCLSQLSGCVHIGLGFIEYFPVWIQWNNQNMDTFGT